jgi:NhaA family Na+:H+ antiporter
MDNDPMKSPSTSAVARFFGKESTPGMVLALAALAALLVSNSPWGAGYQFFLNIPGQVVMGEQALVLSKPLVLWVNDLWMAVFFFGVGLEIKREFLEGELSGPGQLLLPAVAALGGMLMPALIYTAINWGDSTALRGWAIPAATDIAFALGIVALLGSRVPLSLKVFLTAVAIIDDLGAIVVIALFYTANLSWPMLAGALLWGLVLFMLNRLRITRVDVYIVVGLIMWVCVLKSGVHATLAGVITALAIPMRDARGQSPLETIEHGLHPWVSFGVLPMFAFTNAGVVLDGVSFSTLMTPVPLGIGLGLIAGKAIGVFGAAHLMVRSGLAQAPADATTLQLLGVSILCGIGFTMSLFIGGLAFAGLGPQFELQLKLGVLGGSIVAGLLGSLLLWSAPRLPSR